ncbi:MAG: hypothetical protein AAGA25_04030 [Planctomycetota bacterium]
MTMSGCQADGGKESTALPSQVIMLHDPMLSNMLAMTVTAPEDWAAEPIAQRLSPAYSKQSLLIDLRVAAPDGRAVRFYPTMGFEYDRGWASGFVPWSATANGWIAMLPPESYGNWLLKLIEENPAPGVTAPRLIRETELPETQATLTQIYYPLLESYRQLNASVSHNLGEMRARVQAHHASVAYARNEVPELAHFLLLVFRLDQIGASGVADRGTWSIMAMQSKEGPAELGDLALLTDDAMQDVLDSWVLQSAWVQENDRIMQRGSYIQELQPRSMGARQIDVELREEKRQFEEQRFKRLLHDAWEEITALNSP